MQCRNRIDKISRFNEEGQSFFRDLFRRNKIQNVFLESRDPHLRGIKRQVRPWLRERCCGRAESVHREEAGSRTNRQNIRESVEPPARFDRRPVTIHQREDIVLYCRKLW